MMVDIDEKKKSITKLLTHDIVIISYNTYS